MNPAEVLTLLQMNLSRLRTRGEEIHGVVMGHPMLQDRSPMEMSELDGYVVALQAEIKTMYSLLANARKALESELLAERPAQAVLQRLPDVVVATSPDSPLSIDAHSDASFPDTPI